MIEQHKVEEFLYSNLLKVKRKGNGYVARCPICGDSKKHPNKRRLHVDYFPKYDEWMYKCYNGGCPENAGNIQSLYAHVLGVEWKEANNELRDRKYDADKVKKRLAKKEAFIDEKDDTNTVLDLNIEDCLTIYDLSRREDLSRVDVRYILKLQKFITDRFIPLKYNPLVCVRGKYKNRFVLPVYNTGVMVYFQTRSFLDDVDTKYLNPDVVKEEIILNIDKLDPNRPIIMTEGLVDAWNVEGFQGTSCLGASVSDELLDNVYAVHPKADIIIALDNPAIDESGMNNYTKLVKHSKYSKQLRYFLMPGTAWKDLNDVRKARGLDFDLTGFVLQNTRNHFKTSIELRGVL